MNTHTATLSRVYNNRLHHHFYKNLSPAEKDKTYLLFDMRFNLSKKQVQRVIAYTPDKLKGYAHDRLVLLSECTGLEIYQLYEPYNQ